MLLSLGAVVGVLIDGRGRCCSLPYEWSMLLSSLGAVVGALVTRIGRRCSCLWEQSMLLLLLGAVVGGFLRKRSLVLSLVVNRKC